MKPQLQFSLLSLGYDESKGPPVFRFVVHELALGPMPYAFPEGSGLFLINGLVHVFEALTVTLVLLSPEGQNMLRQEVRLEPDPQSPSGRITSVAFLEGLVFPRGGTYWVEVRNGGECWSRYPLDIEEVEVEGP